MLYSPLSIVLVHGVNGDLVKTWKDPQSGTFWPQELLPQKFPQARVLSFGYNADMYRNNSAAGIRDNARTLLSYLCLEREELDSPTPIVFIAHCLGGLIVKQALYFAEFDSDPTLEDADIHINTYLTVGPCPHLTVPPGDTHLHSIIHRSSSERLTKVPTKTTGDTSPMSTAVSTLGRSLHTAEGSVHHWSRRSYESRMNSPR